MRVVHHEYHNWGLYNVHDTLIMEMRGEDLLVTANSHMASLIEVPLAVRSPRLTCNEEKLLIKKTKKRMTPDCSWPTAEVERELNMAVTQEQSKPISCS